MSGLDVRTPADVYAVLQEAAFHVERCTHAEHRGTRHCGESSCWNFIANDPREAL